MTTDEASSAAVVWWKTSLALAEIPRRHKVGWSDISGTPHGVVTITSPHPRLDRRTIENAIAEELAERYPRPP